MSGGLAAGQRRDPALGAILSVLLFPALGVALGALLLSTVVLDTVGLGSVERIAAIGRRLDEGLADAPTTVCLGNSLSVEGIDASEVASAAPPGWRVLSMALNGCEIAEMRVMAPKLLAAGPRAVVLTLRPLEIARPVDIDIGKAHAYALGGFLRTPGAAPELGRIAGLTEGSRAALSSSPTMARLHFRIAPLTALNGWARLTLRPSLRLAPPDDWTAPHELLGSISGPRLGLHVRELRNTIAERLAGGTEDGEAEVRALVETLRAGGVTPILVAAPIHPELREAYGRHADRLREFLRELADAGGVYADASELLGAEEFADAVHPNAEGRARYSRFVGGMLPPL